jgi:hypothetical protein
MGNTSFQPGGNPRGMTDNASPVFSSLSERARSVMVFVKDHNYIQQLFARMINGGSCAIFSAVAGVYACELSPLPVRGLTTAGLNIWFVVGQL